MRAVRIALVIAALLVAAGEVRGQTVSAPPQPTLDQALNAAKAEMLRDPARAMQSADKARRAALAIGDERRRTLALATADWLRGESAVRLGRSEDAKAAIAAAIQAARGLDPHSDLMGNILLTQGGLARADGGIAEALNAYQSAYRAFQRLNDTRGQAKALVQIADLYNDAKDFTSALHYLEQASGAYRGDDSLRLAILNNRSLTLGELSRPGDALIQLREAMRLARRMKSPALQAVIGRNMARAALQMGRIGEAEAMIATATRSDPHATADDVRALQSIAAQAAFQRGRLGEAAQLIDRSFAGVDLANTTVLQRDAHRSAYRIYAAAGRTADALRHLEALKRIDDEATRLATSTGLALMGARFDFANQELRIARMKAADLQRNIAFERAQLRTERFILIGSVAAIVVVLALLGIWLVTLGRSRNRIRAAHSELAVTNDELEKALAVKTEFLATTSHEIRTPLNGILGMTQVMLADAALASDQRERVEVMHGAGLTMRALVDDLLDVAKIEQGRLTLEHAPFDLATTIRDASRLFEGQAVAKAIGFTLDLADCPATVMGDPARIRQIVFNLLSNALKFTSAGQVRLAARRHERGVSISVTDSGIGIPPHKLEEIFEAFRQADASTTRQFGGTGLGLAICRRLARAMGGDVTVESEPGRGSCFTLDLPLTEVAPASAPERPLVLILDRNPIRRAMWTKLCAPYAQVAFAADAGEAASRLSDGGVTQMLIDDSAIREEGIAAALGRIVSASDRPMPVHLLWPQAEPLEGNDFIAEGLIDVIAKPITGTEVMRKMFDASPQTAARPLVTQAA
ncbi:ATP-binding protein [Sphingomonas sanguinis]|uniref:histidine kinase n=1 Tax=Sphingomonas sanguinis TaxID=33051 RepID=A0ABU5LQH9_9SPHN|nr:ATP-binding protein [Sphingomonas sanguinis]MDZ7282006.1 ATP-binding protein [Sphingomonas sanguinis]